MVGKSLQFSTIQDIVSQLKTVFIYSIEELAMDILGYAGILQDTMLYSTEWYYKGVI